MHFFGETKGYTATELVVVISIIAVISSAVLINFTGVGERGALNRSAQELALAIRDTQNSALGVTRVGAVVPSAIGLQLNTPSSIYFVFADIDQNGFYSPLPGGSDIKVGQDKVFPRRVAISTLTGFPGGVPASLSTAHITFAAPEAVATLGDASGSSAAVGDRLDIVLITPSGDATKTITVRTSGQVSIK